MLPLLRIAHIVSGAVWVGSIVFIAAFLAPTIRKVGAPGGAVMGHLTQVRFLPQWLLAAGLVTLLSGLALYWHVSGGLQTAWVHSGTGTFFTIGATLAILAIILGVTVNSPTAKRVGAIMAARSAAGGPPSSEELGQIQALQIRLARATVAAAVLLVGATMAMAVARYIP